MNNCEHLRNVYFDWTGSHFTLENASYIFTHKFVFRILRAVTTIVDFKNGAFPTHRSLWNRSGKIWHLWSNFKRKFTLDLDPIKLNCHACGKSRNFCFEGNFAAFFHGFNDFTIFLHRRTFFRHYFNYSFALSYWKIALEYQTLIT